MGDTSPSKSPPVRSPQPSIEHRSIQSQSPKLPSPVTLSPSAVSKRSVSANQAQSDSYLRRNSPLTIQTPEKIQPSSRQKSPAELAPGSPLQSRNLFSPRASIPEGPILQRNSASLRLSSTEQQRNSVSVREPTPDRPTSPFQRRNSASYQKSTPDKPPSPLQNRNSVSIKAYSPLQQRISPGSVRELSPDKTISLLQQRNSVRVNESATNRLSIPTEQRSPASAKKSDTLGQINLPIPITSEAEQEDPIEQESPESSTVLKEVVNLEPQGKTISEHMDELNETVKKLSESMENTPAASRNIDKIANMSQILSNEANALRNSIKSLSEDIARTKQDLGITYNETRYKEDDENLKKIPEHPHHLFLIELIVNRIQMKCECFDTDAKNLVITATFLARPPVVLYDNSCGKIEELKKINVGKSILSAMTYERICQVKRFQVFVEVSKQPPCSHCVTKIGETIMDFSQEFEELRNDLCKRWEKEKPKDDIICNASTPMMRNQYYLTCGDSLLENPEAIGLIEMSVRMSFLGKEITTVFGPQKDPSVLFKQNNGVTMYSCQKVEMDDAGKVLLDEALMCKSEEPKQRGYIPASRSESPISHSSISQYLSTKRYVEPTIPVGPRQGQKFDEICTKMNDNELRIRVPKSTRVERNGRYEKIAELCSCESTPYNTGEQIQFELPTDFHYPDRSHKNHTSNFKYTYNGCDRSYESKDRKIINVTPTDCPIPVNMGKVNHPLKDVFILKIGKKLQTNDRKTDLEIELVTPKSPEVCPATVAQQCSKPELKAKKKASGAKLKGKGKSKKVKGKGGKGKAKTGKGKKGKNALK